MRAHESASNPDITCSLELRIPSSLREFEHIRLSFMYDVQQQLATPGSIYCILLY